MSSRLPLAILGGVLVVGCAGCVPTDVGLGETVRYAQAVQTIDPDPVYGPDSAQPGDHGDKAAQAVKRYRTNAVKEVERVQTNSGGGGGGMQ
mgnify:CR=1 FL=1